MVGQIDGWIGGLLNRRLMDAKICRWIDGLMMGLADEQTDGLMG